MGTRAEFECEGFRPAVESKAVMAQTQRAARGSVWCVWAEGGISRVSGWKMRWQRRGRNLISQLLILIEEDKPKSISFLFFLFASVNDCYDLEGTALIITTWRQQTI